jgi:hypothetical protein
VLVPTVLRDVSNQCKLALQLAVTNKLKIYHAWCTRDYLFDDVFTVEAADRQDILISKSVLVWRCANNLSETTFEGAPL